MSIVIDQQSATRLLAEGAICFDTDTSSVTCDSLPVPLPRGTEDAVRPVLVSGSSSERNAAVVAQLQRSGLAAWEVVGGVCTQEAAGESARGIPAATGTKVPDTRRFPAR